LVALLDLAVEFGNAAVKGIDAIAGPNRQRGLACGEELIRQR